MSSRLLSAGYDFSQNDVCISVLSITRVKVTRSANVLRAFEAARARGMTTIAMTGEGGGEIAPLSDILLAVPSRITGRVQELHLCLYHYICARIEARAASA